MVHIAAHLFQQKINAINAQDPEVIKAKNINKLLRMGFGTCKMEFMSLNAHSSSALLSWRSVLPTVITDVDVLPLN